MTESSLPDKNSELLAELERIRTAYESDEHGYISFNRVIEGEFNLLGQYAAAFVDGFEGKPKLADDLVIGDPTNWYTLRIKPEDVLVFGSRFQAYKEQQQAKVLGHLSTEGEVNL